MKNKNLLFVLLLSFFLDSVVSANDSITIFVYPPRHEIKWQRPRSALISFIELLAETIIRPGSKVNTTNPWGEPNSINSHYVSTMGHTISHIECTTLEGERYDNWTSFSGDTFHKLNKDNILKNKLGMSVLFYDYVDGYIIKGQENINRLIFYKGEKTNGSFKRPRYMKFEIDSDSCNKIKNMATYFESFHYNKNTTTLNDLENKLNSEKLFFTTNLDPYQSYVLKQDNNDEKLGGGCAPFAIGLLKIAGLYDQSLDNLFKLELNIAERLLGNSNHPISIQSILFGKNGKSWASDGEETKRMSQYDPQKIWNFIGEVQTCLSTSDCKLKENHWFNKTYNSIENGNEIKLRNEEFGKTVSINGITIAK